MIAQPKTAYYRLRIAFVLSVYFSCAFQELAIIGWDQKIDAAHHVQANASVRVVINEGDDGPDGFEFEKEVDGVRFSVVGE